MTAALHIAFTHCKSRLHNLGGTLPPSSDQQERGK